jgi:hypothetical protein
VQTPSALHACANHSLERASAAVPALPHRLQRITVHISNRYTASDKSVWRFVAAVRTRAPALAELHVLPITPLPGRGLTGVYWPNLLAFVADERRDGGGLATVTVVVAVDPMDAGCDVRGMLACAEQEARAAGFLATLGDLAGSPRVMLSCAQTPGSERMIERMLV